HIADTSRLSPSFSVIRRNISFWNDKPFAGGIQIDIVHAGLTLLIGARVIPRRRVAYFLRENRKVRKISRTKACRYRHVRSVAAARDQNTSDTWLIVTSVKSIPFSV